LSVLDLKVMISISMSTALAARLLAKIGKSNTKLGRRREF